MNVAILASSTAFGQAIIVLVAPILTRLYQPDDFGVMAAYASVLSILSVIAALRYDFVIPLPESDREAVNILAVAFLSLFTMTTLTALGIIAIGQEISAWLKTPRLYSYLWLLPLGLLAVGAYQNLNFWAIRKQQFNVLAKTRVSQNLGRAIVQTAAGFLRIGPMGLIIGYILGLSGGIGTLAKLLWQDAKHTIKYITVSGMSQAANRYKRFPLINSWSALINILSQELPVLIISSFFGSTVVGWFYLSLKVLRVPFTIIGQAIAQVFYARATEASRGGELPRITFQVFDQLVRVSLGPLLWLGLMSPKLFTLVFGSNWETSGYYSRWISPLLLLLFITTPLSTIVYVKERQRTELVFQIILMGGRISALYIAGLNGDANIAVISYSLISVVILFAYMLWLLAASGNTISNVMKSLVNESFINLILVIPIMIALIFKLNTTILLTISAISLLMMTVRMLRQLRAFGIKTD